MVGWDGYGPYMPLHEGLLGDLTRKQAREEFNHLMGEKAARIRELRSLLRANEVRCGVDDQAIQDLNDWFRVNVQANPDRPERLENIWYAVVNDIALDLGDVIISRSPGLRWTMFVSGKRNIAYQRHVIAGFTGVANPKYCVDIDIFVATYAHQVIAGEQVEADGFLRAVLHCASVA